MAAQPGIRYSILNPHKYIDTNVKGFLNVIQFCKKKNIKNIYYASSSSVYGGLKELPFKESATVNKPLQMYAVTKITNELMAEAYTNLYKINFTGFRFFTVYGPYGRPDMSIYKFTEKIYNSKRITINGNGNYQRDFTYIDDITETIFRCCYKPAVINYKFNHQKPEPCTSLDPFLIFNVGNNNPVKLNDFINLLEKNLGVKARLNFKEIQPGDINITSSDSSKIKEWINFAPQVTIEEGLEKFSKWFKNFYGFY